MIRKANNADIEIINEIGKEVFANFIKTYDVASYVNDERYTVLVYEDEEHQIDGFLINYNNIDYNELEMIIVRKQVQRKGIATKLITSLEETKKDILLEVATKNEKAVNLYRKLGFDIIRQRSNYYLNDDAYIMKKVIK